MSDYIDREAAREAMLPLTSGNPILWSNIKRAISAIPAADVVAVRHGRWNVYSAKDSLYICSECNCLPRDRTWYCPNCGARMDGDGE